MKNFYLLLLLCLLFNISNAQVNLSAGLAAYYPFTGNANDVSGNNNPSFNNATLTTDRFGNPNSAYHFNGTNNYMQIPNSASINFGNTMSICVWVRPTGFYYGTCHGNSVVMKGDQDYLTGNYTIRFDDALYSPGTSCSNPLPDTIHENFRGDGSNYNYPVYINKDQWYSVVYTSDGTTNKVYVNCQLVEQNTASETFTNTYDLFFGRLNDPTFPYWFNGDLDEVRLYNRVINQDEVNAYGGCPTTCTPTSSTLDTTICQGQSFNGHTIAGIYVDTLINVQGCDSLRTVNLTVNSCSAPTCPLTNSIIINTGYDPVAKTQLAPGQKDTHWIVTSMSSQMQNALCYNVNTTTAQAPPNVPTVPPVPLDQYTDVIAGSVGAISCFPVNTMYTSMPPATPSSGNFSYTMDIKRSFFISGSSTQNVTFNFTTTCDDAIDSIIIDAGLPSQIVLLNVMTKTVGTGSPVNTNYTTSLSPGLHTLSIQCANWEDPIGGIYFPIAVNGITAQYQWNPFIVNITGSISTVNNVLVNDSCFTPTYSTIDTSICQGQSYLGYNVTGTYVDTLTNVAGYDSIRTLNLTINNNCTIACSPSDTLIINTGYNAGTQTTTPSGQQDPYWIVTAMSNDMQNALCYGNESTGVPSAPTGISVPPVALGQSAIVIPIYPGMPAGTTYISCFPYNLLYTEQPAVTNFTNCTTSIQRHFVIGGSTNVSVKFNFAISCDDAISSVIIDAGTPSAITLFNTITASIASPVTINTTQTLSPGTHTLDIQCNNEETAIGGYYYTVNGTQVEWNPFSVGIVGNITSSTNILHNQCCSGTYSIIDTVLCLGQSYGGHGATGTYIDTLTNAAGCDSIRTLNLTINNCIPSPCPSIDSLIINTGYDPVSMAAIPIGQRDSNWIVTAMSTAMQNDPLDVCNPMPSPALVILNTDIVNIPPAPPNSQFISCLSNRIQSTTVPLSYTMTVERKFTLSTADIININMNISVDNILDQISIDGVPQTLNNLPFGSYSFVNYNFTVPLTEGYHTISITAQNVTVTPANYPNGYVFANGFDLIVVGTVKSTTGTNSLVNPNCTCSNPTFSIIDTAVCQGQNYLGYTATGTYIDTLTNVTGCDSIRTLNLTVIQKSFSTIDTSICQGQSFRGHTAAGTYIDTIPNVAGCDSIMTSNLTIKPKSFSTIPATICQGQNYLGYTNSGTFIDTLVAANGCDSIRTINLTVTPYSRSTIPMSICQGQNYFGHTTTGTFVDTLIATHGCDSIRTINLTVNSSSSSIVDTSICPGEASHGYTTGGTYTIILTNAVGCDSTITLNLTVKPSPVVKTNNDTSICKGTTLQVSTTGGTSYSWSPLTSLTFPDNNSDPVINTITPIQYIVTGTTNGCSASDTLNIGIDPLPVISKSNDATICVDSSTRIYANASGAFNFQWSPTSSLTFDHNVNDPIASPLVSTTYDVTVTDANNCVNSDSIKVTVRPPAVFTISPDANACANVSTQLFANGGDTYSWSPASLVSNASIKSPTTSITTTTTYNVQIKENTCGTSASLYTTLTLLPPLNVSASKSNDLDCYISSATLSATGADTYVWSPSTSLNNANIANPIARPFSTQQYIVKGTDELGCVGYDSVTVYGSFEDRLVYNMANAFTPNNDGLNDCYGIEYFGPISQFTFIIYNRWGQEMFHTDDPTACWNGTFQGQDAPVDAYVYYVRAVTACGTTEKKGTVVLIR